VALYNVHEAKSSLSRLIKLAEQGKEVIIARDGKPVAELVKYRPPQHKRVKLGWAADTTKETPGWEKAMSKKQAERFLGIA
jgi:antitoxin (DNA-binding transcriptional repressor) of toxin-antitoxin stability system